MLSDIETVFAGLFSAVVTAFIIESYQNLQPNSGDATAESVAKIAEILQSYVSGESPSPQSLTSQPSNFQPTHAAIVINVTWFLSLSLSILVALVGMLVKQWGESYRSGQGLNLPSEQARIRQSRFDKIMKWHTEDIVLALPVVMHIALGLFLVGLLIFLWDLNHVVALPVVVVIGLSFAFYGLTTVMPLVVAFCPYNTPLSSRILWAYLCRMIWSSTHSEGNMPLTRCEWEEKTIAENSTPDKLTGRALDWLIKYSEDESIVDVAIRAIAGADLPKSVWDTLAKDTLIMLVAQKFTALFRGTLDLESSSTVTPKNISSATSVESNEEAEKQLEIMSLYGRALTNIAKHHRPLNESSELSNDPESKPGDGHSVPLSPDQTQAVNRGLHRLASSESPSIAAFGITSLSAWYMFTMQKRLQWKDTLAQSFKIVLAHVNGKSSIRRDALEGLIQAIPIEISYWKQDLRLPLYGEQEFTSWERSYTSYKELVHVHREAAEKWDHGPSSYASHNMAAHDPSVQARWRAWRAQQAARIYTMYPDLYNTHKESLFLLGLTGMLGCLGSLGLESKFANIVATIAWHLRRISCLNKSRLVDLPLVLPPSFDIRVYAIDRIIQSLRPSPYGDSARTIDDSAKIHLLQVFSEKPRVWVDFGPQLALAIIELLHVTDNPALQKHCLISLEEHSLVTPSPREWELFASYDIPEKLVSIARSDSELRSRAISIFEAFSKHLTESSPESISVTDILRTFVLHGLFEALVIEIVCRPGAKYMRIWKDSMDELPNVLKANVSADHNARCLELLTQLCERLMPTPTAMLSVSEPSATPILTPEVKRRVMILKNKLENHTDLSTT
ncbi:transmembrane protein [Ceratobasidium sp. AG-Ba]|nr:transmembrane protein [Ceratobasidium sp. AG-Ba]